MSDDLKSKDFPRFGGVVDITGNVLITLTPDVVEVVVDGAEGILGNESFKGVVPVPVFEKGDFSSKVLEENMPPLEDVPDETGRLVDPILPDDSALLWIPEKDEKEEEEEDGIPKAFEEKGDDPDEVFKPNEALEDCIPKTFEELEKLPDEP